jgi:hypothetical protein
VRSKKSGQLDGHVARVDSESSKGCRFLKASSEVRGATGFAVLADIRAQLSALEGVEATIEGFGASSGREDKNV